MASRHREGEQCPTCGCPNNCAEGQLERALSENVAYRAALTHIAKLLPAEYQAVGIAKAALESGELPNPAFSPKVIFAMWDIIWKLARPMTLRIGGTHDNFDVVEIGEHHLSGDWNDIAPQLVAWRDLIDQTPANQPFPGPPPIEEEIES